MQSQVSLKAECSGYSVVGDLLHVAITTTLPSHMRGRRQFSGFHLAGRTYECTVSVHTAVRSAFVVQLLQLLVASAMMAELEEEGILSDLAYPSILQKDLRLDFLINSSMTLFVLKDKDTVDFLLAEVHYSPLLYPV